jgi:hypothetical protein
LTYELKKELEKLFSLHPETPKIFPKLKLWIPNNGHLGVQSFSFGRVSGWTLFRIKGMSLPYPIRFVGTIPCSCPLKKIENQD